MEDVPDQPSGISTYASHLVACRVSASHKSSITTTLSSSPEFSVPTGLPDNPNWLSLFVELSAGDRKETGSKFDNDIFSRINVISTNSK